MNTPITEAITVFLAALETAGYHTDGLQIVLPLRVLNALSNELPSERGPKDDCVVFYSQTGRITLTGAT